MIDCFVCCVSLLVYLLVVSGRSVVFVMVSRCFASGLWPVSGPVFLCTGTGCEVLSARKARVPAIQNL